MPWTFPSLYFSDHDKEGRRGTTGSAEPEAAPGKEEGPEPRRVTPETIMQLSPYGVAQGTTTTAASTTADPQEGGGLPGRGAEEPP